MTTYEKRQQELFADDNMAESGNFAKAKERKTTPSLTLEQLPVVTIHYDLFSHLKKLSIEKDINYLIFKRIRYGRCKPSNKYYYSIVAVPAGTPRARHVRGQKDIMAIVDLPLKANQRRNSNQYRRLKCFCEEICKKNSKSPKSI